MLRSIKHRLVDLVLPPRCLNCGTHVDQPQSICGECWSNLTFISQPHCITCGVPMPESASPESECLECISEPPPFAKARAALYYDAHATPFITRFKYSDQLQFAPLLALWMENAGRELLAQADIITPVPLHWTRLFTRKYNQAAILAQMLARNSSGYYWPELLKRVRRTPPQASLHNKVQRVHNVRGAFQLHPKLEKDTLKGKIVLLVDDVMTTGATIRACAKVLKKSGAKKVWVLTAARTVLGD